MCNPVAIVMVVTAVIAAKAAHDQQKAAQKAAKYNAQADDARANQALEAGRHEEFKSRLHQGQVAGSQRAAFAARGLSLNEGSPLNILLDTELMGDYDAAIIRNNAEREAWAHRVNAGFEYNKAAQLDPNKAGMTTLLTSAGGIASASYTPSGTHPAPSGGK